MAAEPNNYRAGARTSASVAALIATLALAQPSYADDAHPTEVRQAPQAEVVPAPAPRPQRWPVAGTFAAHVRRTTLPSPVVAEAPPRHDAGAPAQKQRSVPGVPEGKLRLVRFGGGTWLSLADAGVFDAEDKPFDLDAAIGFSASAFRRADEVSLRCVARKGRAISGCRIEPDEARLPPRTGDDRLDAIRRTMIKHELQRKAGRVPDDYEPTVVRVRDAITAGRHVEALEIADWYFDSHIKYVDRSGGWALTPLEAVNGGGGLCRDYAFGKMALLIDAGWPAEDIRINTILPGAAGRPYHVVLTARIPGSRSLRDAYVLDMVNTDRAAGPEGRAIPLLSYSEPTQRGLVWSGWLGGSRERGDATQDEIRIAQGRRSAVVMEIAQAADGRMPNPTAEASSR